MEKILETLKQKWAEYLLEIMVIIIGIIGAFMLNSWNNNNIQLKNEQLILKGLKKNLVFNLEELNRTQKDTKQGYDACIEILKLVEPQVSTYSVQKVDSLLGEMINYYTYDPSTGAIDEIINAGQLNIIQNLKLKNQISNWSRLLSDTQKDIDISTNHLFGGLIAYLMDKVNFNNVAIPSNLIKANELTLIQPSKFPHDYDRIMTSMEFENLVYHHALNLMYLMSEYALIQSYLETTIELIESGIE